MKILYITEQGATLHKEYKRIVLRKENKQLGRFPTLGLRRILVFGAVQLTTQAIQFLLDEGIDVSFHSMRGNLRGRLVSSSSGDVFLRLAQHDRCRDEVYRVLFSRAVARMKGMHQRAILARYHRNHPEESMEPLLRAMDGIFPVLEQAETVEQIMGYEGALARVYFEGVRLMMRGDLSFHGRNRRPPRDPVNAMLSLGYTLLLNELSALLESNGFDSYLGLMHGFRYGRRSLALDMIEEFRQPIVDRFVFSLCNRKQFSEADFVNKGEKGVLFENQALKRFLRAWEERMRSKSAGTTHTYRERLRVQVDRLEEALIAGECYEPSAWNIS